jgi:nucleotidyltransferase/DNA polymerase involved in DNA repair
MAQRTILHVDMDAFFASVEQRENPEFKGQPVVVGADPKAGQGRGVVAACSYEAREFGIHSALPIGKAYRLCPHAVFVRPRGSLYARVSRSVMEILERYTDLVQPISIDEAFLDVTGCRRLHGDPRTIACSVKKAILEELDLTCSIGLAPNKFLAKVASDLQKPDGLVEVEPGRIEEFLHSLSIRRIWGVGPRTEERLQKMGVRTIGDVAARPRDFWTSTMGKHGEHLWRLSRGEDDREVVRSHGFKSLSHEHTFKEDTDDLSFLARTLLAMSEKVALRARKHNVKGRTVTLKWRYSDFSTLTRQTRLAAPTGDAKQVFAAVTRLMDKLAPFSQKVRLVGVGLSDFSEEKDDQMGLFDKEDVKTSKLNVSLDEILGKYGKGTVKKASLLRHRDGQEDHVSSFLKS